LQVAPTADPRYASGSFTSTSVCTGASSKVPGVVNTWSSWEPMSQPVVPSMLPSPGGLAVGRGGPTLVTVSVLGGEILHLTVAFTRVVDRRLGIFPRMTGALALPRIHDLSLSLR
jgi:hypothetical protein